MAACDYRYVEDWLHLLGVQKFALLGSTWLIVANPILSLTVTEFKVMSDYGVSVKFVRYLKDHGTLVWVQHALQFLTSDLKSEWVSEIDCLMSHATIFQSYMWRNNRCAGGLKKLDLRSGSQRHRHFVGSLTCPSKHRHGTTLFIRWFRHSAQFSRLLRHSWDTEDTFST